MYIRRGRPEKVARLVFLKQETDPPPSRSPERGKKRKTGRPMYLSSHAIVGDRRTSSSLPMAWTIKGPLEIGWHLERDAPRSKQVAGLKSPLIPRPWEMMMMIRGQA